MSVRFGGSVSLVGYDRMGRGWNTNLRDLTLLSGHQQVFPSAPDGKPGDSSTAGVDPATVRLNSRKLEGIPSEASREV